MIWSSMNIAAVLNIQSTQWKVFIEYVYLCLPHFFHRYFLSGVTHRLKTKEGASTSDQ